jgi:hypothetical protein
MFKHFSARQQPKPHELKLLISLSRKKMYSQIAFLVKAGDFQMVLGFSQ